MADENKKPENADAEAEQRNLSNEELDQASGGALDPRDAQFVDVIYDED